MQVTSAQRDNWEQTFTEYQAICNGKRRAVDFNSFVFQWNMAPSADCQAARPRLEPVTAEYQDHNVMTGAEDDTDPTDCVRHSEHKPSSAEDRVTRDNLMACKPVDIPKGQFLIAGRDISTNEWEGIDGYTAAEQRMPILLCRAEEFWPAYQQTARVSYWRQRKGNPNFKFNPFKNNSNRIVTGELDRACILLAPLTLTKASRLRQSTKRRLAEYSNTDRARVLKLKLPFVLKGDTLVHTMDSGNNPGEITGFRTYLNSCT